MNRTKKWIPRARSRLKLQPNPVPESIWGFSAYRLLRGGGVWRQIRRDALEAAGHRCSVCGSGWESLRCLCDWNFSDNDTTAKLTGFVILCSLCDAASHLIGAVRFGRSDLAVRQLSRVNGISVADAANLLEESVRIWNNRNQTKWHLTVGAPLLERYPQLNLLNSANEFIQEQMPMKPAGVRLRRQLSRDRTEISLSREA
jgi:hypothetical protein